MSKMTDRDELDQGVETVLLPLFPLRLVLFPGSVGQRVQAPSNAISSSDSSATPKSSPLWRP